MEFQSPPFGKVCRGACEGSKGGSRQCADALHRATLKLSDDTQRNLGRLSSRIE
ncbi:hypothetical protein KP509_09G066400 [Ceratopteris richardii]|uniref:Uncharacterized protein n=1 Tax=Ceratopteris richardii TaxID=49495 RepID=A0A8T2UBB3_CERRI|nr:hypothetical protein KP509_09G066400 [Ceratopteris richardii]